MFKDLENKVVIITGAGSGIGKSFAENFGKAKSKVVLNYRSDKHDDSLQESVDIIKQAGGDALLVQGDVSKEEDVINLIKQTVNHFGTLDIMINNAGFEKPTPTHEMMLEEWQKL